MKDQSYGLAAAGDGAVGKTSLLTRYALGKFPDPEVYIPVVAEQYVVNVETTGPMDAHSSTKTVQLTLYDMPGQEYYPVLRPLAYSKAHVILICFSIDQLESLENVEEKWIAEAHFEKPGTPILLVGCKCDLRAIETAERLVSEKDGAGCARRIRAQSYFECSSRTGKGVMEIFRTAATLVSSKPKPQSRCVIL